jgi:M6 family metalloprotease-like protein
MFVKRSVSQDLLLIQAAFGVTLLLIGSQGLASGQPARAEEVRALNTQVLRLHGQQLGGADRTTRREAVRAIGDRAVALEALIRENPAEALRLAFSQDLLDALAAAFPEAAGNIESHGAWEGPAEVLVIDEATMQSSTTVVKIAGGDGILDVHFAGAAPGDLQCGSILRVEGVRLADQVAGSGGTLQAVSRGNAAAATAACGTTGVQKVAVILVTFPGVSPPVTAAAVQDVFFGSTGHSVDGYWRDASYGLASATGQVFGWYTIGSAYACDQYSQISAAAVKAADADVNFQNFNRVFFVFPRPAGCTWGGLSTVGCSLLSTADGSVTASTSYLIADILANREYGVELAIHEGGHSLTLNHARSRGFGAEALGALGAGGTITEYGDYFDPMGYYNLGHYSAQHKLQLGWIASSNVLQVKTPGAFSVAPMGTASTSVQALQVQRGTGSAAWLWIEYHQPLGSYESALSSQIFSGATIRYQDSLTGTGYGNLLDFTPLSGSWYDPALAVGQTWTDPYSNVSVSVASAAAGALSVGVNYAAIPCTPAPPAITISPANPSVIAGATATYTVTIANTDSGGCAAKTINISTSLPAGWAATVSPASLSLAPGQSGTVSMGKTPPAATAPGTYQVDVIANSGSNSVVATANCSVTAAPPPLTVTVAVSGTAVPAKSTVSITASVFSALSPIAGASVQFTIVKPNGGPVAQTVTTNSSGVATISYKPTTKGTYAVSARAASDSRSATSATATFQVQ